MARSQALSFAIATLLVTWAAVEAKPRLRIPTRKPRGRLAEHTLNRNLLEKCTEQYRDATLDHFTWVKHEGGLNTFKQRYFVCKTYWQPNRDTGSPGPIFFYLGNEADVLLYLNNTGLMWENAPQFGAMLVFAEHRYYGKSVPYGKDVRKHMGYLSAEQAMVDYAELVMEIKEQHGAMDSAVIAFGGSYGGMLASWMRMKYPHILDGSIAGSAPIWNFFGEEPPFDSGSFAKGVTYDAGEMAGSAPACVGNVRATWELLEQYGTDQEGRDFLHGALRLCPAAKLPSLDVVLYELRPWLAGAWDSMAMGNFPYPSSYILNGNGQLPAFPVRVACQYLAEDSPEDEDLLEAMADAVGVYYNHSGTVSCYDFSRGVNPETDDVADFWDYQWCTEMFMPFSKDGVTDMFWKEPFDAEGSIKACQEHWGVTPRPLYAQTEWGGRRISAASNIVFSNGLLDPWHGGGVLEDVNDALPAVVIPEGAHHLDLMFSHPDDPMSVIEVRKFQLARVQDWIDQAWQRTLAARRRAQARREQQQRYLQHRTPNTQSVSSVGTVTASGSVSASSLMSWASAAASSAASWLSCKWASSSSSACAASAADAAAAASWAPAGGSSRTWASFPYLATNYFAANPRPADTFTAAAVRLPAGDSVRDSIHENDNEDGDSAWSYAGEPDAVERGSAAGGALMRTAEASKASETATLRRRLLGRSRQRV